MSAIRRAAIYLVFLVSFAACLAGLYRVGFERGFSAAGGVETLPPAEPLVVGLLGFGLVVALARLVRLRRPTYHPAVRPRPEWTAPRRVVLPSMAGLGPMQVVLLMLAMPVLLIWVVVILLSGPEPAGKSAIIMQGGALDVLVSLVVLVVLVGIGLVVVLAAPILIGSGVRALKVRMQPGWPPPAGLAGISIARLEPLQVALLIIGTPMLVIWVVIILLSGPEPLRQSAIVLQANALEVMVSSVLLIALVGMGLLVLLAAPILLSSGVRELRIRLRRNRSTSP